MSRGLEQPTRVQRDIHGAVDEAWALMRAAPGFLTEREGRFLALAAAATPASGKVLEIGSFKGKSTVGLGAVARRLGFDRVVAVDPFTAPASTDPKIGSATSTYEDFVSSLKAAGVEGHVEAHRGYSRELAASWKEPIRLLWVDGDHTYAGAKADVVMFRPYLAEGAVVALHDTLNLFEGPLRVVVEDLLESDDFGPAGFCGSIGWAQFRPRDGSAPKFRAARRELAKRARRVLPLLALGRPLSRVERWRFKLWRSRVPHDAVEPERWMEAVAIAPRQRDVERAG